MKQRNCRPCQGIQSLTPRLIQNPPGQRSLRYRVGTYPEFFESMLAALSRGTPGSVSGESLEREQAILRHLTARDQDDPSIALFDAWAVLADVLTFYNERYAAEAFVGTALQRDSLYELASQIGYAPRPGLSSSVFLSFEVDDKSNTVLIPGGTQAKSTPIPGSGQRAETFETVQDFVAHPSFNRIRPELTRPHNLKPDNLQNIDRLYFKGLGLRLQPNDYLAIGDKDAGKPVMKKISSIEERRDTVQGPITVANLEPDIFNVNRYVLESQLAFDAFFSDPNVTGFIKADKIKNLRDKVQSSLDLARNRGLESGIAKADDQIETDILTRQLLKKETKDSIRELISNVDSKFAGKYDKDGAADKQIENALELAVAKFKDDVDKFKTFFDQQFKALFGQEPDPNTTSPTGKLEYSKIIFESVTGGYSPNILHGFPKPMGSGPSSGNFLGSALLELRGINQNQFTIKARSNKEDFQTVDSVGSMELQSKIQGLGFNQAASFVILKVFNNSAANKFEFAGVSRITEREDGESPEDLTVFVGEGSNEVQFDPAFSYKDEALMGEVKWKLEALDGCEVAMNQFSVSGLSELPESVKNNGKVTFKNGVNHCTVLMTLSANGDDQAFFIRRFVKDKKPIYLRNLASIALGESKFNSIKELAIKQKNILDSLAKALVTSKSVVIEEANSIYETMNTDLKKDVLDGGKPIADSASGFEKEVKNIGTRFSSEGSIDFGKSFEDALTALKSAADSVSLKKAFDALLSASTSVSERARACVGSFESLLSKVVESASRRRFELLNRLDADFIRESEGSDTVKKKLSDLFDQEEKSSVRAILNTFSRLQYESSAPSPNTSIEGILKQAFDVLDEAINSPGTGNESGSAKSVLDKLRLAWAETRKAVDTPQTLPGPPAVTNENSALSLVQRILGGGPSAIGGNPLGDVTSLNSSTWIQVVSALREPERQVLLQVLRDYRRVSLPKDGNLTVWAMRSAANLFGWNTTGEASSVEQKTPKGFVSKFSDYKAELDGSSAVLDGKYVKSVGDTPIAVRTKNDAPLQAVWAKEVTLEPKHAYGISNESTMIAVSPSINWSSTDFSVIRSTKVFCDAERLELAEVPLADLKEEFMVSGQEKPGKSTDTIVLDGFVSELDIGRLVLSGIPATNAVFGSPQPSRQDRTQVLGSELLSSVEVTHNFPQLHGERIKTVIKLQSPLKSAYWLDTIELNANVVEATHGETVGEVLGSGDARKAFQAFPLRRAPITRLSAPKPFGKIEALQVSVNNTTWEQRSQLVDGVASDEIYELRGNRRDPSSTLQFGNGMHGTRLPTGVENVKATYRVGLGEAGNAIAGQINQLPSPPFGVKGVNNPLAGEGGTDADNVEQSRRRIPAYTASLGRLVSASDFETFALCFAGIDKAKVLHERGVLKLVIAGANPAPISRQGQLFRNFLSAIQQQGVEISEDQIQPHAGLLLHVHAQIRVPLKYDWETIQRKIEDRIFERFGYASMQLGESIYASEMIETIQRIPEVQTVALKQFVGLSAGDGVAGSTEPSRLSNTGSLGGDQGAPESAPKNSPESHDSTKPIPLHDIVRVFEHEICYVDRSVRSTVLVERMP